MILFAEPDKKALLDFRVIVGNDSIIEPPALPLPAQPKLYIFCFDTLIRIFLLCFLRYGYFCFVTLDMDILLCYLRYGYFCFATLDMDIFALLP